MADAFTWSACSDAIEAGEWYLVAFRSVRRANADEARLTAYDDRAHAGATNCPGFVHYTKGPTADDGSCLSFCLWTTRHDARAAAGKPAHAEAALIVHEMYDSYRLEFLRVWKAHPGCRAAIRTIRPAGAGRRPGGRLSGQSAISEVAAPAA